MSARFGRVITAMVTPFRDDLSPDLDEAQRLARWLADHGTDGIVVAGSTGEAATMTHAEKTELFRAVKDAVDGNATVIAGAGTYSTAESVDLAREAEKAGVDGLLVVTPYYVKPPQRALLEHFRAVASSCDLPVMLYDVPGRTALKIGVPTLLEAAEHPNIVALKDAAADFSSTMAFVASKPDDFELYSGNDDHTLAYQALGAVGTVSVLSNIGAAGLKLQEQFAAFESGDVARARAVQCELMPLYAAVMSTTNPIGIKAAVTMLGFRAGRPRPPLAEATPSEQEEIRRQLESLGAL